VLLVWSLAGSASAYEVAPVCAVSASTEPVVALDEGYEIAPPGVDAERDAPRLRNACEPPVAVETADETSTPPWTEPLRPGQAREELREAERLMREGRGDDALLHLRVVERAMPRIEDRIAQERGELLLALGSPGRACAAFEQAARSLDRNVAARGRVGAVKCLLRAGDREGEKKLQALLRRYPLLTEKAELRLEQALARERWGNRWGAARLLRSIDVSEPASPVAARARAELARLTEQGVELGALPVGTRIDRAERLQRSAPLHQAAAEVQALRELPMNAEQRARVHVLAARIARIQGRWETVEQEVAAARRHGATADDLGRVSAPPPAEPSDADSPARHTAERRIRGIVRGRPLRKLTNTQLRIVLDLAVRYGMAEEADAAVEAMAARRTLVAGARFDAAIRATGLASDANVAALFETLVDVPRFRVAAAYHLGRAYQRLGRNGEAEAQFLAVIEEDRSRTRYYAMWADQGLWALRSSVAQSCAPPAEGWTQADSEADGQALAADSKAPAAKAPVVGVALGAKAPQTPRTGVDAGVTAGATLAEDDDEALAMLERWLDVRDPAPVVHYRPTLTYSTDPHRPPDDVTEEELTYGELQRPEETDARPLAEAIRARVIELLSPLEAEHGEAFPWLGRAMDLTELERFEEAADELNEAYMAWRDAKGSPRLRSGLEAVYTGSAPPRRPADFRLRKARLALQEPARTTLATVARLLGDPGVGLRFGTWRIGQRPRAYPAQVHAAAEKYGVDPNLLFAVMRVESIYNRRIVSYAGAVGLMQIMPATGRRIADRLGVRDFQVTDLLDPQTNVEFSAWYLSSLIQRFEGRLPLAIASYNGGPHNVRLWMRKNHPDMPLDAFLELIPFSQTHRYVRRVLTHYAAYRAQERLPMTRLDTVLPDPKPDPLAF
jgi:soluble lytic murein transglycosylase